MVSSVIFGRSHIFRFLDVVGQETQKHRVEKIGHLADRPMPAIEDFERGMRHGLHRMLNGGKRNEAILLAVNEER